MAFAAQTATLVYLARKAPRDTQDLRDPMLSSTWATSLSDTVKRLLHLNALSTRFNSGLATRCLTCTETLVLVDKNSVHEHF